MYIYTINNLLIIFSLSLFAYILFEIIDHFYNNKQDNFLKKKKNYNNFFYFFYIKKKNINKKPKWLYLCLCM
jgi:hypothetical protein